MTEQDARIVINRITLSNSMDFNFKKALRRIIAEELKGNNPIPDILSFFHLKSLYEEKLFGMLETLFVLCKIVL